MPDGQSPPASSPSGRKRDGRAGRPGPDDDAAPSKPPKRRASRACVTCRARKVRCDVVDGMPCGNCKWDHVACEVEESRRRKKQGIILQRGTAAVVQTYRTHPPAQFPGTLAVAGANPNLDGTYMHSSYQAQAQAQGSQNATYPANFAVPQPTWPAGQLPIPGGPVNLTASTFSAPDAPLMRLPHFIKPPLNLSTNDILYLRTKGALDIPEQNFRTSLLAAYTEFVHPFMPLLDLHDFLNGVHSETPTVSLLLYQAVMFAASVFVDPVVLVEAGFPNRLVARKVLYMRAKLLYSLDAEVDRLTLVQSLLLMSNWYEDRHDVKDTWHWLGIANSLSDALGLSRADEHRTLSDKDKKLAKRVWWCMYMRNRMVALGMRRHSQMVTLQGDVKLPEESDCEIKALPEDNHVLGPNCTIARDTEIQRALAVMWIQKMKLCRLIDQTLTVQYGIPSGLYFGSPQSSGSPSDNLAAVTRIQKELTTWHSNLPDSCRYRAITRLDNGGAVMGVHRNLLHMTYNCTISALLRPQIQKPKASSLPKSAQETIEVELRRAASAVDKLMTELRQHQLVRFLPPAGVTVLLPTMVLNLRDLKNSNQEIRDSATRSFLNCMDIMRELGVVYTAAANAIHFLQKALASATIRLEDLEAEGKRMSTFLPANMNLRSAEATPPPENMAYLGMPPSMSHPMTSPYPLGSVGLVGSASPPQSPEGLESTPELFSSSPTSLAHHTMPYHPMPQLTLQDHQSMQEQNGDDDNLFSGAMDWPNHSNEGADEMSADMSEFVNLNYTGLPDSDESSSFTLFQENWPSTGDHPEDRSAH